MNTRVNLSKKPLILTTYKQIAETMKIRLLYLLVFFSCIEAAYAQRDVAMGTVNNTGGTYTACNSISLTDGFSFSAKTTGKTLYLRISPSACNSSGGTGVDESRIKDKNYIITKTFLTDDESNSLTQIQYYDGLGRLSQTVQKGVTPGGNDLVSLQEYDVFGRQSNSWLPAVITGNNGLYVDAAKIKNNAISTHLNDQNPYSFVVYESSPLNRVQEQYSPGQDWQSASNKKAIKTKYLSIMANNDTLNCINYEIAKTGDLTYTIYNRGNFSNENQNPMYVKWISDEDGNTTIEFKNNADQVLLTRQIQRNGTTKILHDTYYIYDELGNLSIVLPPLASDETKTGSSWVNTSDVIKNYTYQYMYDKSQRCIAKKLPGAEWIYCIYDKGDHLIFTQDGEQRKNSEWAFSISDVFGRVVLTGTCKNSLNFANDPLENTVIRADWAKTTNIYKGYTVSGITLTSPTVLSANYYDNYEFIGLNDVPTDLAYTAMSGFGVQYMGGYAGLLTGSLVALLDGSGNYIYTTMFYDNRGRVVQTKSTNHLPGGLEKEYFAYNFTGQPTEKLHLHSATGKTSQTETYKYAYDHAGRLLSTTHRLNTGATVTLLANTYDELGRLLTKKRNNLAALTSQYTYNVRSWTKSITGTLFSQTLYYNESYGGSIKQYNGNISAMKWSVSGDKTRGYGFTYDNLSRLTAANYLEEGVANTNYKTSYTYDKQGNIKTLQRYGKTSLGSTYGLIDNLTINHRGNQILKVDESVATIPMGESTDFKNYSNIAAEYQYNANGAMIQDLNKGISSIQYNSLNLPQLTDIKSSAGEARNEYTYAASGRKLKVVQKWNPNYNISPIVGSAVTVSALTRTKTTDYVGNIIYEDGSLKRILVDGGYIEDGVYYFYLNDHLGNNRVVANANGTIIQKNHYYPFGMTFAETPNEEQGKQPYKYNNKEFDPMHGLNLYDYSARYMDAALPSFTTMDPHSENYYSWSPYVYVGNNPMKLVDPTGMDTINVNGLEGLISLDFNSVNADDIINVNLPEVEAISVNDTKQANEPETSESEWYAAGSLMNWGYSLSASALENTSGSFRMRNGSYNGNRFSPKYYQSGWAGGSRAGIKTYNAAKLGKLASKAAIAVGIALDANGVREYLSNPNSQNAVTPAKMGVNLGVTAYASWVNPVVGIAYFGIEALYPGGSYQFGSYGSETQNYVNSKYGVNDPWTRPKIIPWGVK